MINRGGIFPQILISDDIILTCRMQVIFDLVTRICINLIIYNKISIRIASGLNHNHISGMVLETNGITIISFGIIQAFSCKPFYNSCSSKSIVVFSIDGQSIVEFGFSGGRTQPSSID